MTPLDTDRGKRLRNPSTLFRAGDTLYLGDWGLRQISRWTLDGGFAGATPAPNALRGVLPRDRDGAGRYYLELRPPPGPDGQGNRDSAVVVRASPALDRADTLARLAPLDIAEVMGDAGRRFERRVFSGTDQWGARPDGSLWVARVSGNRVDWRDPTGKWTRGEPLPDRVLEVTRYDRELFLRRFPPELRTTAEQLPFARDQAAVRGRARRSRRRSMAGEEPRADRFQSPLSRGRPPGPAAGGDPGAGAGAYHRRGAGRRAGGRAGAGRGPAAPVRLARAGREPMRIPFASVRPLSGGVPA